jgi:hypothetical protein
MSQGASQVQVENTLEKSQDGVDDTAKEKTPLRQKISSRELSRKRSVIAEYIDLSDTESDDDEEFFDAIDAGEVEIGAAPPAAPDEEAVGEDSNADLRASKHSGIVPSFQGYEDPVRERLNMDADDRPKISLWVCPLNRFSVCLVISNVPSRAFSNR